MKRHWLSLVLVFCLLVVFPLLPSQSAQLPAPYTYYFPVIQKAPLAEVIVTTIHWVGYHEYAIGFVRNLTSEPLTVTVAVDITTTAPWYITGTVYINTAFPITLPGQVNPFHYETECWKLCNQIDRVYLHDAGTVPPGTAPYYPLTISTWHVVDNVIIGKVINHNSFPVDGARVVIAPFPDCQWGEAAMQDSFILPGTEVTFTYIIDSSCLSQPNLMIIGQGYKTNYPYPPPNQTQ